MNGCSFDDGSLNGDGDETPDEEESSVEGWSPSDRPLCQVAAELVKVVDLWLSAWSLKQPFACKCSIIALLCFRLNISFGIAFHDHFNL